jgi:hypothetical protein
VNFSALTQNALGVTERFLKKNGPTLLTGSGLVGFGVTTVLVGKSVLRAQTTMASFHDRKQTIEVEHQADMIDKDEYAKKVGKLYIGTAKELTRVFWPAITVGVVSAAAIVSAHGLMKRREASLVAAYAAVDAGFKAYRKRIQEELGPDKELELYRGVRSSREDVNDAGAPCIINEYDKDRPSPYARFFDQSSPNWTKTPEYNLMFLTAQQQWANDQLRSRGHIFLNEVLDALALERSQAGQIVGWKSKDAGGQGDDYVDFGLYTTTDDQKRAFINGSEPSVLLDFNVDGPITI